MKSDKIRRAIGGIDDELIEAADNGKNKKESRTWIRWAAPAAVFVFVLAAVFGTDLFKKGPSVTPRSSEIATGEFIVAEKFIYSVDAGRFAAYVGGKVIAETQLGNKLEDVTVTGGWFSVQGTHLTRLSEEHVKAEIFEIKGISADVAVAVKFLEKMDAATTDHFYVILNPQADLTPVQAYVIPAETQGEGPVLE